MVQQTLSPPLIRGKWFSISSEDFDALVPDGMQAEWVDGKGIIFVAPSTLHARRSGFLTDLLRRFVPIFDLGEVFDAPVELRLPNGERREPDVFVVLKEDLGRVLPQRVEGTAAYAAEFLSTYTAHEDQVVKLLAYAAAGIREYLIVDARAGHDVFEFYRLNADGKYDRVQPDAMGRYHSEVLPGFWLRAEWFRRDPLPIVDDVMLEMVPEAYEAWLLERIRARRA